MTTGTVIVYFDGYCNICNGFVDFLIRRDHKRALRYAPIQGWTAATNLPPEKIQSVSTMAIQEPGRVSYESAAAIRAIAHLGGIYSLMKVFLIVPPFLRNFFYRLIASNRYRWFGKRDACRLPTAEERAMFLP